MNKDLIHKIGLGGITIFPQNPKSAGILVNEDEHRIAELLRINEEQKELSNLSVKANSYINNNDGSKKAKKERKIRLYSNMIEFLDYDWSVIGGSSSRKSYVLYKNNVEVFRTNFRTPYGPDVSLVKQVANLKELFEKVIELEEVK